MARKITCTDCGKMKPTPPDDAALGLFERRTYGTLLGSAICDYCGKQLDRDDSVIALSVPSDMRAWEHEYMNVSA